MKTENCDSNLRQCENTENCDYVNINVIMFYMYESLTLLPILVMIT